MQLSEIERHFAAEKFRLKLVCMEIRWWEKWQNQKFHVHQLNQLVDFSNWSIAQDNSRTLPEKFN